MQRRACRMSLRMIAADVPGRADRADWPASMRTAACGICRAASWRACSSRATWSLRTTRRPCRRASPARMRRAARRSRCGSRRGFRRAIPRSSWPLRSGRAIIAPAPKTGRLRRRFRRATACRSARLTPPSSGCSITPAFRPAVRGRRADVLAGLARHGRPIQYAHVRKPLALWDVWTQIAADPVAFEPPSAGFALDWRTLAAWRAAASVLPRSPTPPASRRPAIRRSTCGCPSTSRIASRRGPRRRSLGRRRGGGSVIAIGTTVVRALEAAATADGGVHAGDGVARGRIAAGTRLRSSTRSSPACTRRAKAISSCCAPSPTMQRSIASRRS